MTKSLKKISTFTMAVFFRQFATLIQAGIPIVQACDILIPAQANPVLQFLILSLQTSLQSGQSLASTCLYYPQYFNALTCQLIAIGEKTGKLDILLNAIANQNEKAALFKKNLQQACIYPLLVCLLCIFISTGLLVFIVPRFAELFKFTHHRLPALTRFILDLSFLLRTQAWLLIFPILGSFIFCKYYRLTPRWQWKLDHALMQLPWIGLLIKKYWLACFTRSLSTMLSAGIPIAEALPLTVQLSRNHYYQDAIQQLHTEIQQGQRLYPAMQHHRLFLPLVKQMIQVGEESGLLDLMLAKIADFYENDLQRTAAAICQLLEPLIILILGVLIGVLAIALYLPIFQLGAAI